MKRLVIFLTAFFLGLQLINAQNETDALRYSRNFNLGTARSVGMGGAVGALGGDFTSISVNPAGLGIYRGSEFTITPTFSWNTTTSDFLGNTNEDVKRNFNIGNLGYVSYMPVRDNSSGWISTSFGIGLNTTNNFNQRIYMGGINNQNSFLDDFSELSDDPNSGDYLFYKELAFADSLLVYDESTQKYSNDFKLDGYGQFQERLLNSSGTNNELTLSFGANYNHKLYIGAAFALNRLRFDQNFTHTEDDRAGEIFYVDRFDFYEDLTTRGLGLGFKIGIIGRPVSPLRIGLAYHIPTFYFMNDKYTTDLTAYYDDYDPKTASSPLGDTDYRIITPGKLVASATGTIGEVAIISLDYEYIDYGSAKIESENDRYSVENSNIKEMYKAASNIRAGAEVRFNPLYLRAGYGFYGSPFERVDPSADESHNVFSAGLGVRTKTAFVDFGWSTNTFDQVYYMSKSQVVNGSINSAKANNLLLTVGFRF